MTLELSLEFFWLFTSVKGYKLYDLRTKTCFLSRDVFKEFVFPFKSWISKFVTTPSPTHSIFPTQSSIPDQSPSIPNAFAEFSPHITLSNIAMPPNDLPDLVHPNDISTQVDSIGLIPTESIVLKSHVLVVVPIRVFQNSQASYLPKRLLL